LGILFFTNKRKLSIFGMKEGLSPKKKVTMEYY